MTELLLGRYGMDWTQASAKLSNSVKTVGAMLTDNSRTHSSAMPELTMRAKVRRADRPAAGKLSPFFHFQATPWLICIVELVWSFILPPLAV